MEIDCQVGLGLLNVDMRAELGERRLRIAILIAAHNRRPLTVRAVKSVSNCETVETSIVVFDDGSADGTAGAVKEVRPDAIIVQGTGDAFWNGGMRRAWEVALDLEVDAFLWLNDDVDLDGDALSRMAQAYSEASNQPGGPIIIVGGTRNLDGSPSYGGLTVKRSIFSLKFEVMEAAPDKRRIETFHGNIALVGKPVVDLIGLNDPGFLHNLGDIDYGLRASKAGARIILLNGTLGVCEYNAEKKSSNYGAPHLSLKEQWQVVNTHQGLRFADWWLFTRRHSGALWPLHFLLPYRHLLKFWNAGRKSRHR